MRILIVRWLDRIVHGDQGAVPEFELTAGDDQIAGLNALEDRYLVAACRTGLDDLLLHPKIARCGWFSVWRRGRRGWCGARGLDDKNRCPVGAVDHRGLRQRQVALGAARVDADIHVHAWQQL